MKNSNFPDIIISHNSPFGIHDKFDLSHKGYAGLTKFIEDMKPKFCIHGHQHINQVSKIRGTQVIGVYGGILLNLETLQITEVLPID